MKDEISKLLSKARNCYEEVWQDSSNWNKKYAEAINCYQQVLRLDPFNIIALINLGACLLDTGRHAQGLEMLKKAEKIGSKDKNLYFNIAVALMNINAQTRKEAKYYFEKAVSLSADNRTIEAYFDPHGH